MRPITLLALVDGLRHDYISPSDAPFLAGLAELNASGAVRETFAYQLRPAFLAGLQPEQCGVAHMYLHDPASSPYRGMPSAVVGREGIRSYVRSVEEKRGHSASALYGDPFSVPRHLLPHFAFSERLVTWQRDALAPHVTVFDLLREAGERWLCIAYPGQDQRTESIVRAFERRLKPDHRFVFLHFAELDWAGHEHGPDSVERRQCLRKIDKALMSVYSRLNRDFTRVDSIVFGDHGMAAVRDTVDIEGLLSGLDFTAGEEYVYFLDSTQARFWFRSEEARRAVRAQLEGLPCGRVLSNEDLANLSFRFPDSRFGELIWVADGGVVVLPNFYQRDACPAGMHGYLPDVADNWGWLCVATSPAGADWETPVEMTRLFPTLLDLLQLGPAPGSQERRSLLAPADSTRRDVSVVVPSYNRAAVLKESLDALHLQTYPHDRMEVVVIDDGSTDETGQVVRRFAAATDLAVVYERMENSGPAAARNRGVSLARGSVVLFIGDDIVADSALVAEHVKCHSPDDSPFGRAALGHTTWHPGMHVTSFMHWLEHGGPQFDYESVARQDPVGFGAFWTCNISVKRDFLRIFGLFDQQFRQAVWEDIELGCRLSRVGLEIRYVPEAVAYHKHATDLASYARRQLSSGRSASLMLSRCPEMEREILRRAWLGNPLLLLGQAEVEILVERAERSASTSNLGAGSSLSHRAILAWFFAKGLFQGLQELGPPPYSGQETAIGYLLARAVDRPDVLRDEEGPKPSALPAAPGNGLWIRLGGRLQCLADRVFSLLPQSLRRLYLRLREWALGW
jgi:GT2 family glycosyltransferase